MFAFSLRARTHARASALIKLADAAEAAVCALDGGALLAGRALRRLLRDVAARHVRDVCRHQLVVAAAEREARHLAVASVAAGLSHAWACVGVARRDLLGARCWGRARGQRQSVA